LSLHRVLAHVVDVAFAINFRRVHT
jgi:hypothetical protein